MRRRAWRQLRRLDLADRQPAQSWKRILFKPDQCASCMAHTDLTEMDRCVPFTSNGLEAVDDDF
jgi:hypothetical protein